MVGVAGTGLTVTFTVAARLVQPFTVTVTEYVPLAEAVTLLILGFWAAYVKPLGPVQLYVPLVTLEAFKVSVAPTQTGPLLLAMGAAGTGVTVTFATEEVAEQPLEVTVTE